MLRVEDASTLAGTTTRTIYRWIEAGKLHFAESDKGLVLICAQSLAPLRAERTADKKTRVLGFEELDHQSDARPGKCQ